MGTTICPMPSGSQFDDEGGLVFPERGLPSRRLREAAKKKMKAPKNFMHEAMGFNNMKGGKKARVTVKKFPLGKQAKEVGIKKKKKGPFGEIYSPIQASNKGTRAKESRSLETNLHRFRESAGILPDGSGFFTAMVGKKKESRRRRTTEKAPPGWEGSVKKMKKHSDIDNPFALAWSKHNQGDTPHVKPPKKKETRMGGLIK